MSFATDPDVFWGVSADGVFLAMGVTARLMAIVG